MCEEFLIIRGKRIEDQLNEVELCEQSTYADLERNILNFQPVSKKRQHATDIIRIVSMETLPFIGTKNLNIWATANSPPSRNEWTGQMEGGGNYSPKLIFNQVEFENEDTPQNITFKAKDGKDYHMKQIDLTQSTVRVSCNCLDFRWRFAAYNAKDKSLIGSAGKSYQPISNRGPVNPQQVPGVCKHLISTVKALKHSGMVR